MSLAVVLSNSFFSHADEIRINTGFASSKLHSDLYKSKLGLGLMLGFTVCNEDVFDFKNFNLLTEASFQFLNTRTAGFQRLSAGNYNYLYTKVKNHNFNMVEFSFSYLAEYSLYDEKYNKFLSFQIGPNASMVITENSFFNNNETIYYGAIKDGTTYSENQHFATSSSVENSLNEFELQFGLTLGVSHQLNENLVIGLRYYKSFINNYIEGYNSIDSVNRRYFQLNLSYILF